MMREPSAIGGSFSSVTGGGCNRTEIPLASVTGGEANRAVGTAATVSGGARNYAGGQSSCDQTCSRGVGGGAGWRLRRRGEGRRYEDLAANAEGEVDRR